MTVIMIAAIYSLLMMWQELCLDTCNFLLGAQTAIYLALIDCFFIVVDETAKM